MPTAEEEALKGKPTVLGRYRANPYETDNMRALAREVFGGDFQDLPVTHQYVKFTPRDHDEADDVDADFTTHTHDVRYEVDYWGERYRDPAVADDQPHPVWSIVPADQEIPEHYRYELLAELYIPLPGAEAFERLAYERVGEPFGEGGSELSARSDDADVAEIPITTPGYGMALFDPLRRRWHDGF